MRMPSWLVLVALGALMWGAAPAWSAETQVKLEYSPLAPLPEVQALQRLADEEWTTALYLSVPQELRPRLGVISTEHLERGVVFHVALDGSEAELEQVTRLGLAALQQVTDAASLSYALRLTVNGEEAPAVPYPSVPAATKSLPPLATPAPLPRELPYALAGLLALAALGLGAWVLRRRQVLSLPTRLGLPILGILPAGLGLGGRFLELQSPPAQALGVFFRRLAHASGRNFREAVVAGRDRDASAVVAACLAIALLRERGRVLVVDLAGAESPLPEILEETTDAGELPAEGTLRATAIADLDLLTGLVPSQDQRPPLPNSLVGNYRWVIYLAPPETLLEASRHVWVLSGQEVRGEGWRLTWQAFWRRASVVGVALVGMPVPAKLRDRLMARFYFEKLKGQEVRA